MIYNKVEKKSSLKALKELKENAQEVCEWELDRLNIIEKDLEILEIFKNNLSVKIESCKFGNVFIKDEYIAYNGMDLDIMNKEEYNKIKEWILK